MADTRQRLIEAAEQLFADRGIDAVSLAEVTAAAGLNNTGAVHYHFGGREELLAAVVEQHRTELDSRRELLFDQIEEEGDTSLTALVRVLVEPLFAKLDDPRGRAFLSIQAQRMLRPRPDAATNRPVALRFLRLLGTPHVPPPVAALLGELTMILTFGALAQRARVEAGEAGESEGGGAAGGDGEASGPPAPTAALSREEFAEQLIAALVRIHAVPPRDG